MIQMGAWYYPTLYCARHADIHKNFMNFENHYTDEMCNTEMERDSTNNKSSYEKQFNLRFSLQNLASLSNILKLPFIFSKVKKYNSFC